jgi:hypothetical protein
MSGAEILFCTTHRQRDDVVTPSGRGSKPLSGG